MGIQAKACPTVPAEMRALRLGNHCNNMTEASWAPVPMS